MKGSRTTVAVTPPTGTRELDRRGRHFAQTAFSQPAESVTSSRREAWPGPAPGAAAAPCNTSRRHGAPARDAHVRRSTNGRWTRMCTTSRPRRRRRSSRCRVPLAPSGSAEPTSEKLAQPIRRTLTDLPPSRWTRFGFLAHLALGPHPGRTPVLDGLLQSGQPAELEPESEATAERRSVGREVLHSPIDQVLGRLEMPFPTDVDRPETNPRRREPGHRSRAFGQEPIPVSPQMHARTLAAFLPRAPLQPAPPRGR